MENIYLHFNGYEKVIVNENHNIPTVVYRDKEKTLIGYEVYDNIIDVDLINSNFKIDIGRIDSKSHHDYRTHKTADGVAVSALKLTELFFSKALKSVESYLEDFSTNLPKSVLIAEPLVLQQDGDVDERWLTFYRRNIKNYFEKRGFENISFLPEPFAVFQYYKYCKKFAPLNKEEQIVVLVIDFGGGTFDTCIIETSEKGDIKEGGKNSKPLGASSIARGGSDLDIAILNSILLRYNPKEDVKIKKSFRLYRDVKKGKVDLKTLNQEQLNFFKNYQRALIVIQEFKEKLSNNIKSWSIETDPQESISLTLQENFFENNGKRQDYQLSAVQLREIFKNFYNDELKKGVRLTLERGLEKTKKKKPDYILLSGGSSKIGWLNQFLIQDFAHYLDHSEIVKLDNYKEVVSAGLAIESARKFYNETGDFADTTYNTVNLVLNPNNRGIEIPKFKPLLDELKYEITDGLLIPASTNLRKLFNTKLKWKFKLKSEPKNNLDYFFLRNSLNQKDDDNLLNIIDSKLRVDTKNFDKYLELEIDLHEDGTAIPVFKLNSNKDKNAIASAKPFFIDMTYGAAPVRSNSYLGIDFGTCNSSISFVSNHHIEKYNANIHKAEVEQKRALIEEGPYPISYQMAKFQNEIEEVRKAKSFVKLFENGLALLYYITMVELKAVDPSFHLNKTKIIRAAGSILLGFRNVLSEIKGSMLFSSRYKSLFDSVTLELLNKAVNYVNDFKHDRLPNLDYDYEKTLIPIYDAIKALFKDTVFGYFDRIHPKPFSQDLTGDFIVAHGHGIFTDKFLYEGSQNIPKQYAYIIEKEQKVALNLFPLIHWDSCKVHRDEDYGHCYFFDKFEADDLLFSAVTGNCNKRIIKTDEYYQTFRDRLDDFFTQNSHYRLENISLKV